MKAGQYRCSHICHMQRVNRTEDSVTLSNLLMSVGGGGIIFRVIIQAKILNSLSSPLYYFRNTAESILEFCCCQDSMKRPRPNICQILLPPLDKFIPNSFCSQMQTLKICLSTPSGLTGLEIRCLARKSWEAEEEGCS